MHETDGRSLRGSVGGLTDGALRVLMISHHRRSKVNLANRSLAMARHLARRGHSVTLLTTADSRKVGLVEREEDEVNIIEIPDLSWGVLRSGWDPWSALNRLLYLLRSDIEFDLVHLFESRPSVVHPTQLYRLKRKPPLIIDWVDWIGRGGILEVRRPRWYRILFGRMETFYEEHFRANSDGLTVICTALAERGQGLGLSPDAILHIPVGVDFDVYPVVLEKAACRRELGFSQEEKILIFAGVDADFDLPLVMGAFARVAEQYPETRLMLTGKSNPAMLNLAGEYGIADRIISTGYVPFDRFPTYLGCADVFLLPFPNTVYNVGRWPSKVCDYMASGRPIVSNPTGDIRPLFEQHEIGLLAEETQEGFAAKVLHLLQHPKVADTMGRNARHIAETRYEWGTLIQELEVFYDSILERRRKTAH